MWKCANEALTVSWRKAQKSHQLIAKTFANLLTN